MFTKLAGLQILLKKAISLKKIGTLALTINMKIVRD